MTSRSKQYAHLYENADSLSQDASLWEAIRDGDRDTRDKMIEAHVFMLEAVATKMKKSLPPHIDVEDLKSYGALGLLRAVDTYDPAKGTFRTHAGIAIYGKILDELRANDWAPKSLRRKARDIDNAIAELQKVLKRTPEDHEVAEHLGLSIDQINNTRLAVRHSTHKSIDDMHPHMQVQRDPEPEDTTADVNSVAFVELCLEEMRTWYDSLDFKEQVVLALYYYKGYKLAEVAHETGLSEAWVVSTHSQKISELRERLLSLVGEDAL
jgi:RNA polymerase sigma factor for flagellar operon FliA